jgi:hypothetical protein
MEDLYQLPSDVLKLVEHLNERYPDRCIIRGESLEDAHRLAGARDVINYLTDLRDNPEVAF